MTNSDKELILSRFLLQKYADVINEREQRTIGEIKALVDGKDLTVQSIADEFKGKEYVFSKNYASALLKAFEFVKREIHFVDADLNLNYWLSAREIMEVKVADDEDLAVFMCALLKALGDDKAEVIIAELESLRTHAFVATELAGDFIILDPAQGHALDAFKGKKADVIGNYAFNTLKIKRFLYRFNSAKYEQFLE